jgi:flagellar L-ring protein FlgH
MTYRVLVLAAAALVAAAGAAQAGSIWAKSGARSRSIATDDTARQVGDTLTIVIRERAVIGNDTQRTMDKKSDRNAKLSGRFDPGSLGGHGKDSPSVSFNETAETKFDGSAKYDSDRSVSDSVTVVVVDVMPNGNLLVLGTRMRDADGDQQIVQLSGIVRTNDIAFNNTVRSDQVADFRVVHKAKGRENTFTKPGWLDGILNILNPF